MSTYYGFYFLKKPLLFVVLTSILFSLGIVRLAEVHAQTSLLDATAITIDGEEWTFRTPPPLEPQRQVISSHPRLYITQANLDDLKLKLGDPIYADDLIKLRSIGDGEDTIANAPLANALLYLLEDDIARGNSAKDWLLLGSFGDVPVFERAGEWVEPILVFDWIYPLLTDAEKIIAFNNLRVNFDYDHRTAVPRNVTRYWNDEWARHQELHYPILALAIAGDGIDDTWADEVLELVYTESPLIMGPYGPNRGSGFLDMLASTSLDDGGGEQVGSDRFFGSGYYNMYLHSIMPMAAWETATGEPMWARSPFFRKIPEYWAYDKSKQPASLGSALPEMLTGIYRTIDPDTAALARFQVNQWGRYNRLFIYRLIFGDLRVLPKSPAEIGLPTAKYIRGGDLFVSSRSWAADAFTLTSYSRYLDTSRFESGSGIFAIHRGQEPLAVAAEPNKERLSAGFYSGLWVYDPSDESGTRFQDSTYWGLGPSRADDSYTAASNAGYFPGGPDNIVINSTYRGISTEYSEQLKAPGVRVARQTIVHILDENRDFIVVYNYTDIPANLRRAWSMRLAVTPSIAGNSYSIPGMRTTIVAPVSHTISWVGGVGDELKGPPPEQEWYGNDRAGNSAGYSSNPDKAKANGIGNLFVQATNPSEIMEFLVVIEAGSLAPVSVSRTSDREASFGDWQVSFSADGNFTVVNTGVVDELIHLDGFE